MEEHVYFLQIEDWPDGNGPIKIGRTRRGVNTRFREWQCGVPFHRLKFLGKKRGGAKLEAMLKRLFAEDTVVPPDSDISKTEWFWPSKSLLNYIEEHNAADPSG